MFTKNPRFQRRPKTLKLTFLLIFTVTIALMLQWLSPVSTSFAQSFTNTPTFVPPTTTPSYGCISPADCVSKMTLAEKMGQMTQADKNAFTSSGNSLTDITTYFIGSVLSGGGEGPSGAGGTASQWTDMVDNIQSYALKTRLAIPVLYGVDAVHGHNNVYGSTLFPHHIGMGATHDTALITQAEQVTRDEVLGTGDQVDLCAVYLHAPG